MSELTKTLGDFARNLDNLKPNDFHSLVTTPHDTKLNASNAGILNLGSSGVLDFLLTARLRSMLCRDNFSVTPLLIGVTAFGILTKAIELFIGLFGNAFCKFDQIDTLLNVTDPPFPPTIYPKPRESDNVGYMCVDITVRSFA
ncbi:unnamed protein product [Adineta ricciae]|uniref:Uncharacterized protein n=1 Tax=Adineta ricciae TaxID=249248 RepID=A0A815TBY2_ADIRI|nr:unnamed protein product [Adineta ricciae]CAF1499047.1 unnamed protein product [Adineta ricciae]